ncbi:hypothetical protein [Pseudomonas sp. Sample_16]|uniref:HNH endonuclease n=1 Tax=Pseudomonas sp. Sample_16 TaxID=2448263 RepID=UPI001032814D|nr:hypothetical protein [Pseudomonas sp. Sample_16]
MIRLARCATIPADVMKKLDAYPLNKRPILWKGKSKPVKQFRDEILAQGIAIQANACAWCRLPLGREGRRTIHRDHIAPKALHPVWTFLPINVVLACEYCNGFENKSDTPTIAILDADYEKCKFLLVHPYLDRVKCHIAFDNDKNELPVLIKGLSEKGRWTINKLKLDTTGITEERAKEVIFKRWKESLSAEDEVLVTSAVQAI